MDDSDYQLLGKVLTGEAGTEEREAHRLRLLQNPEYASFYNSLSKFWKSSVSKEQFERFLAEDWELLKERFNSRPQVAQRWWPMAAAFALLLLGGILLYFYFSAPAAHTYYATDAPVEIILADSSKVTLNKRSELVVPADFAKNQRLVVLKGEAFFEVTHNASAPFMIESRKMTTKVLGTTFNVYAPEADSSWVYLQSGKVEVSTGGQSATLLPGQMASVGPSEKLHVTEAGVNTIAWKTRVLKFRNATLRLVAAQCSQYYELPIVVENNIDPDKIFLSIELNNYTIEQALSAITFTLDLQYRFEADRYIIF